MRCRLKLHDWRIWWIGPQVSAGWVNTMAGCSRCGKIRFDIA